LAATRTVAVFFIQAHRNLVALKTLLGESSFMHGDRHT
jgi:hypothetical protein